MSPDEAQRRRGRPPRRVENKDRSLELASLSARIRRSQEKLRELEEQRNALVHQAIAEGWTHAQIAHATGLTRSRVGQIALRDHGLGVGASASGTVASGRPRCSASKQNAA